jgi:hypothetical protein
MVVRLLGSAAGGSASKCAFAPIDCDGGFGLEYKAVEIQVLSPKYQRGCPRIAYVFRELNGKKSALIAPGVASMNA